MRRVALLTALLLLAPLGRYHGAPGSSSGTLQQLRLENARLQKLAALASGKEFYLLLEPRRKVLKLMFAGVVLNEYPVLEVKLGRREVLFVERELPDGWLDEVWEQGQLEPRRSLQRREIVPPSGSAAPPAEEEVVIPPTPEEAVPAPDFYHVRYKSGKALEIRAAGVESRDGLWARTFAALRSRIKEVTAALLPSGSDTVRLRVVLERENARMLYRSLPDNSSFFMVHVDPSSPAR